MPPPHKVSRLTEADGSNPVDFDQHFLANKQTVIVLHGINADESHIRDLATGLVSDRLSVICFDYDWLIRIEEIGAALNTLLLGGRDAAMVTRMRERGVFLVGHSLGGLVARWFFLEFGGVLPVHGIAVLGTPSNGVFRNPTTLRAVIEQIPGRPLLGKLNRIIDSSALPQLLAQDGNEFLATLNRKWRDAPALPRTLSIAGNHRYFEFVSSNAQLDRRLNKLVQEDMGRGEDGNPRDNDGFVPNASVNLRQFIDPFPNCTYHHEQNYPLYDHLNHSALKDHSRVIREVRRWIEDGVCFLQQTQ